MAVRNVAFLSESTNLCNEHALMSFNLYFTVVKVEVTAHILSLPLVDSTRGVSPGIAAEILIEIRKLLFFLLLIPDYDSGLIPSSILD